MGVDEGGQKCILEGDGTENDADKDDELSICDDLHRGIVVGFNPGLELLGERMRTGCTASSGRWTRRKELREKGRTSESQGVEQRENHVREEGNRNRLPGRPPIDSEQEILNILIEQRAPDICQIWLRGPERFVANDSIAD